MKPRALSLALCTTGLIVSACTGGSGASSSQGPTRAGSAGGPASSAPVAKCANADNLELPDLLAAHMSAALQKHDRARFLALAVTPAARNAMSQWWSNVSAIGFTTGAASYREPRTTDAATTPTSVDFNIGFHNALDPYDDSGSGKTTIPTSPATQYRLATAESAAGGCHLTVTGWRSLSDAPWDVSSNLYVVHGKHTVVAGEQQMKTAIDRVATYADKAASWNLGFFAHNGHADYIQQRGFMTFVPSTRSQEEGWFRARGAAKPKGWVGDSTKAGGYAFPLDGVQTPDRVTLPAGAPRLAPSTQFGGGRVIITAAGRDGSNTELEGILVHEFVHDIFANDDLGYYLGGRGAPATTVEGAARWVQAEFLSAPTDPVHGRHGKAPDAFAVLKSGVKPFVHLFHGSLPSNAQIYGSAATADYYYDLSATVFDYEHLNNSLGFGLQCIKYAYLNGGSPFTGVLASNKGGVLKFAAPATVQQNWAGAVRKSIG